MDDYYRRERLERLAAAEAAAENARAARFRALDDALGAVLYDDTDVIDGADRETLARARQIVSELREVW